MKLTTSQGFGGFRNQTFLLRICSSRYVFKVTPKRLALMKTVSKGYKNDPTLDNNRESAMPPDRLSLLLPVLVTRGVYWSMLECGLSLTCACLPSLNGFARLPGIQSVLSSARSLFSLDSRDYRSSPQQRRSAFMRRRDELDTESQATFADAGLRPVEMVSVHSVAHTGGKSFDHGVSVDAIHVESTIEQTSSKI